MTNSAEPFASEMKEDILSLLRATSLFKLVGHDGHRTAGEHRTTHGWRDQFLRHNAPANDDTDSGANQEGRIKHAYRSHRKDKTEDF